MMQDGLADRAHVQRGVPAAVSPADHQQPLVARFLQQGLDRAAQPDTRTDREVGVVGADACQALVHPALGVARKTRSSASTGACA